MNDFKILLVDDEQAILDMLKIVLQKEGFRNIQTAANGKDAIEKCKPIAPHLIVLDVILPDMEGFEVCRRIREITSAPVLFLTAKTSDLDKLMGFGMGGDDYITKPFNPLEVVARIKAQLRRLTLSDSNLSIEKNHIYDFGRFKVDEQAGQLIVDNVNIICPAREFQLLLFFCKHPNRVFSRDQLYEQVWGDESFNDDNTVMVHIRRLREKIEINPSIPHFLVTVRGLGYKLATKQSGG